MRVPVLEAFAYPLLLGATVAIYRVGRARGTPPAGAFEWTRLATLAALLGLVMALQVRFAASGQMLSPLALAGATLSIAALVGLVGLHVLALLDAWRAPGPQAAAPAA